MNKKLSAVPALMGCKENKLFEWGVDSLVHDPSKERRLTQQTARIGRRR